MATVFPTCSITVSDATGYKNTYGQYLRGASKLQVSVKPDTSASNSPIETYRVSVDDVVYTTSGFTTDVLRSSGNLQVTATVTDKRGNSAQATTNITVYDYFPPTITNMSVHRCNADGTENDQGAWVRVDYSGSIDPIYIDNRNRNSAKFELYYRESGSTGSWQVVELSSGYFTVNNGSHKFEANTEAAFDVKIVATDNITSTSASTSASTAYTLLDFGADGKSLAVGKVAELSEVLDIGFETRFYGGIKPMTIPQGTNLNTLTKTGIYVSEHSGNATYYQGCNLPEDHVTGAKFIVKVTEVNDLDIEQVFVSLHQSSPRTFKRYAGYPYSNSSFGNWLGGDTGWKDLTIKKANVTVESIGLKSRIKDGVLYIKGAVKGISAATNDEVLATLPEAHIKTSYLLRFNGTYNGSYFCGLSLATNGDLRIRATNGLGSWSSSYTLFINEVICL